VIVRISSVFISFLLNIGHAPSSIIDFFQLIPYTNYAV